MPDVPDSLGLCPADHMGEFYMPDALRPDKCPQCEQEMLIYVPAAELERLREAGEWMWNAIVCNAPEQMKQAAENWERLTKGEA